MVLSSIKNLFVKEPTREENLQILNNIFSNVNGHQLSSGYREREDISNKSLTYGEVKYDEFAGVIEKCQPNRSKTFYDIGSGTGKPCFTAALLFDFKQVNGVEYIPDLHETAQKKKDNLAEYVDLRRATSLQSRINFKHGDALLEDFSDGDVIFCNSTCFGEELVKGLLPKFEELKVGTYIICLTKTLNLESLELIFQSTEIEYSWGKPTTRIYKKIA